MTNDRLLAVKNATCEAIDHLHKSLESCPDPESEVPDPRGIKVSLLAHQRRALAWLLWRETQNPCGGILADDMGLGKTLTIISLILAQKRKTKEKDEKKEEKEPDGWISKTDSSVVVSKGTLIICPASLIHHWTREVDRHVKKGLLTVYLYHGAGREKSAKVLADYDLVVTTYSLVSKEIPVQREEAGESAKDPDHRGAKGAKSDMGHKHELLSVAFLRCSPFDEFKLWKAQVDNGSNRGRERLNLLTRSLLLRRTKDQQDSTGRPLVSLPSRTCEVHRLKLSEDEQAVYDVVFARSSGSGVRPFSAPPDLLGLPAAVQRRPHPEQLNALSLAPGPPAPGPPAPGPSAPGPSAPGPQPADTVALNGTRFPSRLFEDASESTKISALTSQLMAIRDQSDNQRSMLGIVGVHLRRMGLRHAVIDGSVSPKRRMDLVEEFNSSPKGPQVMLVSLCAGGVGLNLIGGNHLFLIDMHWNPALEDQACDRIYRVGQQKDVTIHRFVCEGTVEEKISTLQAKKKELAQNVLSGTGSTVSKLSLADLKIIF
ncbi:unnamed protein product, partial [Menidia menidia]